MTRISEIRRGVTDPNETASFFTWLLGIEPIREASGSFRFAVDGGSLTIDGDANVPVGMRLSDLTVSVTCVDPDGVPVVSLPADEGDGFVATAGVRLDHIRMNCADLQTAASFYRSLGFALTWSGRDDEEQNGPHQTPMQGANWMHLSCDHGYMSLSQADWEPAGIHSTASGAPRFMHIGLEVADLTSIFSRLDEAGLAYLRGSPAVGRNLYVNDPDGDFQLGTNVELIEYTPGARRSGENSH